MTDFDERAYFETIEAWRWIRFDRAEANCCHFVADVLGRATGQAFEIPASHDVETAREALEQLGSRSLYAHMVKLFGKPLAPLHAHIGYVMYRQGDEHSFVPGEATVGIADRGFAWFLGRRGLEHVKLSQCAKTFRAY